MIDWKRFDEELRGCIGIPYRFGAEANLKSDEKPKAFDCSELVEWAFARVGVRVPDGSENQYQASRQLLEEETARIGDVGFVRPMGGPAHHVVINMGDGTVIEARGNPYNKVIYRPVKIWEAWDVFSGWRRFNAVEKMEAA